MNDLDKKNLQNSNKEEGSLKNILEACFNEIERMVNTGTKEELKEEKTSRQDRGFGLSFVDSDIPEGVELDDNEKVEEDLKEFSKVLLNSIMNKSNKHNFTVHSSNNISDIISSIIGNLNKEEEKPEEKCGLKARRLTPQDLELLIKINSVEEIASKYDMSEEDVYFLCSLWDIDVVKKPVQVYFLDEPHVSNIVNSYLSLIDMSNNDIKIVKHFIESFNALLPLLNVNVTSDKILVLPVICKQFNTKNIRGTSTMLVCINDSLTDVLNEIKKYGYIGYVDKLLN